MPQAESKGGCPGPAVANGTLCLGFFFALLYGFLHSFTMIPTSGIAVDGSCLNNPGPIQWRGVDLETGTQLFCTRQYQGGTNNVAEFLAIVHALAATPTSTLPVYSDSQVARGWVQKGYCLTTMGRTVEIQKLLTRANAWLKDNRHTISRVQCWQTREWGENKADFNRKR